MVSNPVIHTKTTNRLLTPDGWKAELAWLADHREHLSHEVVTWKPYIRHRSGKVRQPKTDVLTTESRQQRKIGCMAQNVRWPETDIVSTEIHSGTSLRVRAEQLITFSWSLFHCFTLSSKPTFSENLILHLSLFLSDWSHGSRPFTGLICSSVLCFSSIFFCFSYSYVRQTTLASSLVNF